MDSGRIPLLAPAVVAAPPAAKALLPLCAAAVFLGALLVFWLEPMFAKMVLPLLGGSPAVWNTAMMFFQAALLAGYGYAHLSTRFLQPRRQALLHMAVLAAAAISLPVMVPAGWTPPTATTPVPWLIGLLAVAIGLPFIAVSATAPLLQRWFSQSGHAAAADPYFLYAASNLGSLLALVTYPTLVESHLRLSQQSWAWTIGYGLLGLLVAACGLGMRRGTVASTTPSATGVAPTWRQRLHWIALAGVPSSLLLGVTTHISTDVAAAPLLWVIPLALYLLSFVLVFARRPPLRHDWMVKLQPFVLLPLLVSIWSNIPGWAAFPVHLAAFFVTIMVCHGELSRRRPAAHHLTDFYLCMSVGGLLGGAFNALIAPVIFSTVVEYPLALALACLLRPHLDKGARFGWQDLALPALILATIPLRSVAHRLGLDPPAGQAMMFYLPPILGVTFALLRRPFGFALAVGATFIATVGLVDRMDVLTHERSFFGVYRVTVDESGRFNLLIHGTTMHGVESRDRGWRDEPQTYYLRQGPLGQVFAAFESAGRAGRVAVIGLGAGTTAAYRHPGQDWTFYEIDPVVEQIARDDRYFSYLSDRAAETPVVLGDARLALAHAPERAYDLMILDAFSSDAIPLHLMTREALRLYLDKLAPGGLIAFHISNRMLDLAPVLGNLVADAGAAALIERFRPTAAAEPNLYIMPSDWVVIARAPSDLALLAGDPRWVRLGPSPDHGVWTDDFSNILEVFRWR
jgi:hypothetical protein